MSISLLVKRVIAGILAFFMPITSAVAVKQPPKAEPRQSFHAEATYEQPGAYALAESEDEYFEYDAPEAEPTEETPAPVIVDDKKEAEDEEPVEEETLLQNATPVAEWDISETDEDDVHMYLYADEDENLLDTIAASVRALFVPITAYAETTMTVLDEEDDEDAEGIVVITGSGATEEFIFLNWLDHDKFVAAYEAWCEERDYADDAYTIRANIDDKGRIEGETVTGDYARGLYAELDAAEVNKTMLKDYVPIHICDFINDENVNFADYMRYSPRRILVGKNVTDIGFYAFAFCTAIDSISFSANAKLNRIEAGAFAYTGIENVTIPKAVRYLGDSAFRGCENLNYVHIIGILNECGENAFAGARTDIRVITEHIFTFLNVMGESTEGIDVNDNDYSYYEDTHYYYGSTVSVVLDTALFNAQ